MKIRRLVVAAVCACVLVPAVSLGAGALETTPTTPIQHYDNGPTGPLVYVIGDSISSGDQRDYYAYLNGSMAWHTHVASVGGQTINGHIKQKSFYKAKTSKAKAVFVELGTNDISGIVDNNNQMPPAQRLVEIAKVFTALENGIKALGSKCIVWVGLNEVFDTSVLGTYYTDKDTAAAFDRKVVELTAKYPNLHYADYSSLIRNNTNFRNSLQDGIHPATPEGKTALAQFEVWYTQAYCNPG